MTTTALKTTTALTLPAAPAAAAPARASLLHQQGRPGLRRRPLAMRLELAAVLSLLGSSAAYALYALCHLA